jgi:bacterioferritin-associated ferredoxin
MYVCVCLAVTQSEVERAIEQGATSREAITRACKAGGDCGACHGMLETMIDDHLDACCEPPRQSSPQLVPDTALVRYSRTPPRAA